MRDLLGLPVMSRAAQPVRWAVAGLLAIMLAGCAIETPVRTPLVPASASMPTPRATPAPASTDGVTSASVEIPAWIDATGASEASAALTAFVRGVPDGSTILFPPDGIFRMDRGLELVDRKNLTFEGRGSTLRSHGASECGRDCSLFYLRPGNSGITIRGFTLVGNSPTPGTFDADWEHASGLTIVAGRDIEIEDVRIRGVGGDGVTLTGVDPYWPDGVRFHDSQVISCGRMGVAVVAGRNVTIERITFGTVGYGVFDIEPNDTTQGATDITFRDNTVGSWGKFFAAANGAAETLVRNVTVSGNEVTGSSLLTIIITRRRENIVFSDNVSTVAAAGPILQFAHVDGLTVTNNVQPLTSGVLMTIDDSRDVVTQ